MKQLYYIDSSALVKRYRLEEGTSNIDILYSEIPNKAEGATSFLALLEVVSALRRKVKNKELSQKGFEKASALFSQKQSASYP